MRGLAILLLMALGLSAPMALAQDAPAAATAPDNLLQNGDFARGMDSWTFAAADRSVFSLSEAAPPDAKGRSLRYHNSGDAPKGDYSFYQSVAFKPGVVYRLSCQYKGDGALAPMILLNEDQPKGVARRMFRLDAATEWRRFEVEFTIDGEGGAFRAQFYPGSAPNLYVTGKGTPNAARPGEFHFADLRLAAIGREDYTPPPGPYEVLTSDTIYKKTDTTDLVALIDTPVGAPEPWPVMVIVHGGGWVTGGPDKMAWRSRFLAERGVAAVRIQYRLVKDGGTFDKTISDVLDSVEWVRVNAEALGFDARRLGLMGGSAGAHLSAVAAQRAAACGVYVGLCGLYDAVDIGEGRFARGADNFLGAGEEARRAASAIHQIRTPPPAALLLHGAADPTIDYHQAVRFAEALRARGGRADLLVNEGCGHEVGKPEAVNRAILAFLNREWGLDLRH